METSVSLLDRLAADPSDEDWRRLVGLYRPLLRAWMARSGVADADADDLTQDVLLVVFREVKDFRRRAPVAGRRARAPPQAGAPPPPPPASPDRGPGGTASFCPSWGGWSPPKARSARWGPANTTNTSPPRCPAGSGVGSSGRPGKPSAA